MKVLRLAAMLLLAVPASALAGGADETPICTDRPAKANAACTVPIGKWQLEGSAIGWSRTDADGVETRVLTLGSTVLKFGLSERSDLQVGWTPYVRAETRASGIKSTALGIGDLIFRYKRRLNADNAPVQIGMIPFIKLPTADRDIGNGKVEGGLAVPISVSTDTPVTVVLGPELDMLVDNDGNGYHAALINLLSLSAPIAPRLTLVGELWTMANLDPDNRVLLASADAALAYAVGNAFQFDVGANVGLNSETPDLELYTGLSFRF